MSNPNYRPLLPAAQPRSPPSLPPPKRTRISAACDACRTKRTRCDGSRPTCAACTERSSECTYTKNDGQESRPTALKEENSALNAKVAAFNDIVNLLKRMSPEAAQHALHRLSTGSDPVAMLKTLRGEPVPNVGSDEDTARAIFPAAHSRCELELLVRHPIAYQVPDMLSRANSLRLHLSQFYSPPDTPSLQSAQASTSYQGPLLIENSDNLDNFQSDLDLGHAQQYFDPRLAELNIDFWTSVSLPNKLAAKAISCYIEFQHPVWGVFDAWLFVRDLVQLKFDYCSPFMLSSVLAASLQFYTVVDPEAAKYSLACEKEAEALYKAETSLKSLPTLSGMAVLHVSMTCHGEGNRGMKYLMAAIEAAKEIKLFGVPDAVNTLNSDLDPGEALVATSAAAWGLFNMAVHQGRFFSNIPIVSLPPALPHPGDPVSSWKPDRSDESESNPITERRMTNMDQVISAFSRLWTVVNEVLQVYRNPEKIGITLAFALSKYSKLLGLVDKLPKVMVDEGRISNHAFMFLITLHYVILDLFRPFIKPESQHGFRSYLPLSASPLTIFAASATQLKSLIFTYTSIYPPSAWNLWLYSAVVCVSHTVLDDLSDPERRIHCFFYAQISLDAQDAMAAVGEIGQAILAMGHGKGVVTTGEAAEFAKKVYRGERGRGGFAMDAGLVGARVGGDDVDTLVGRLGEILAFEEFTDGVA